VLTGLALKGEPQPQQVFREWPDELSPRPGDTALARIQDSGVLRVCYRGSDYPSAFFNTSGDLVGFDIELAHRFASTCRRASSFCRSSRPPMPRGGWMRGDATCSCRCCPSRRRRRSASR
jgi:hypothetical protein